MATRKRTAKKATSRRSNSNIKAAQQETRNNRARQEAAKRARAGGTAPKEDPNRKAPPKENPKLSAGNPELGVVDPRTGLRVTPPKSGPDGKTVPGAAGAIQRGERMAREGTSDKGNSINLPGLGLGFDDRKEAEKNPPPPSEPKPANSLSNPALFGGPTPQSIGKRLSALQNEQIALKNKKLRESGGAVFLGTKTQQIRRQQRGGEFEGGTNRVPESVSVDDVRSKDELMSWLADEKTFNQIRDAAKKSGIQVQSYDDVAKIWQAVVNQAAATYSTTGKKVTPWALLQLRGKTMVNGKPAAKTTTSTSIEEMDPAQAKVMLKNSLSQFLGRDPRQDEIEDFMSKAQAIAQQNPNVTTTTTQFGFDGEATSQSSVSKGGADVVSAKAQLEAERLAKEAPDYKDFQAAGVYMPWFNEALSSPF